MPLRDIVLTAVVLISIPYILRNSYIGILMWAWVSYMNPHRLSWDFAVNMPFAQIVAIAFFISLVFNREPKRLPQSNLIKLWLAFIAWMGVTTFFAIYTDAAMAGLEKSFKIQLMLFFTMLLMGSADRIRLMIWVIFLSIGFFGIKGGIFTLAGGGGHRVFGPAGTFIGDNNHLAAALLMILPLGYYLVRHEAKRPWVRYALYGAMLLIVFAIVGSYSRGAFLGILAVAFYLWWKSPSKLVTGVVAVTALPIVILFMPEAWHERISSINDYEEDASAQGRLNAWKYSVNLANDRVTGGGFDSYSPSTYQQYAPDPSYVVVAHSIYFGTLADHGWIGLGMFVWIYIWAWMIARRVIARVPDDPDIEWAVTLLKMIQVSLLAYGTAGTFLSLAYFDLPWHMVAIVLLIEQRLKDDGYLEARRKPYRAAGGDTRPLGAR